MTKAFAPLIAPIGFYPVVPTADWVQRLLGWGVRTIQLRIKAEDHSPGDIADHISSAVDAGRSVPGAQVFINDHWKLALAYQAYGVHMGQEDLTAAEGADLFALREAGLRLGLSTHTPFELERAHAVRPSYLAIGPIYPTNLKVMPYEPVGLDRLSLWAAQASLEPKLPVVAIGGISLERLPGVWACLPGDNDGVAVVSAVTLAGDPAQAARDGMRIAAARHG